MRIVLEAIPFQADSRDLQKRTRARPGSEEEAVVRRMVSEAEGLARPRAAARLAFIDHSGLDEVQIEGVSFSSRVLSVNLGEARRVFAVLATCGAELEAWAAGFDDLLLRYYAEQIKEMALYAAFEALTAHLTGRFHLGRTAFMSPGSLADWPITEQRPLFELLDGLDRELGVRLTGSLLMLPTKSISGLRFPKEESFESCQLCPRPVCPNRRAPYDPNLYEQKYRSQVPGHPEEKQP